MKLKRSGVFLLGALAMTIVLFYIDINFYNDSDFTKDNVNEILFWSFVRGLMISMAVSIGNHYRLIQKK
ncbi:hypothetical protein SAMN05421856_101484 [Chryseobacterium taichungense]|uniref:Uncharacterized protein n=1 Tax=Chryseobacterium taichungense TaxID=295069 RepID=A0A1H7W444_9FLAO|nr:hypothetical protein [Chryseobacterium taichungense]SEM16362.1 hypothetical protein SAMN05421856_101484 [Chryseobacterium taichungense]